MNPYRFFVTKKVSNEQLVRQVDRKHNRELLMVAASGLSLAVGVLAYGWQHFEMIRVGYQLEELRLERERLLTIHRQLNLERASLASPDRVEAIATRRLGMAPPIHGQVVVMEPLEALDTSPETDAQLPAKEKAEPAASREPNESGQRQ